MTERKCGNCEWWDYDDHFKSTPCENREWYSKIPTAFQEPMSEDMASEDGTDCPCFKEKEER